MKRPRISDVTVAASTDQAAAVTNIPIRPYRAARASWSRTDPAVIGV